MDLDSYETWSEDQCLWMHRRLDHESREELRSACEQLGTIGVLDILQRHVQDIRDFFDLEQNQRESIVRRFDDETQRIGFLIAASYTARCGYQLLSLSATYGFSTDYKPTPAFLMLQGAQVARELYLHFPRLWPFADGTDPLGELSDDD